jgi:large subunit ribosomal protein L21
MYAIFEDGSRQYRVEKDSIVTVDHREIEPGKTLEFNRVLVVSSGADTQIGQPLVAGAKVIGEVIDLPTKKTVIQHFRRRKNYRRLKGHTQPFVRVKITEIVKS